MVISRQILAELADVLSREKFAKVGKSHVNTFLSALAGKVTTVKYHFDTVSEDPDDDIILSTAYDGKAIYIVTGDRHLLDLRKFHDVGIATANEMLHLLGRGL